MKQFKKLILSIFMILSTGLYANTVNMAPIITYLLSDTEPQGEITINDLALQKAIASIYDNTPYSPAIDIQGVIDAGGLSVAVPYTVTDAPVTLEAYSTSVILDASVTQDDEAGIVATFAWAEQTNLPVGSGTFTATITIDDSNASIPNNTYNAKQLDTEDDSSGLVAAIFPYDTDNVGGTGVLTLKIMPGIPDRMFGQADNTGNTETHKFLYLPVTNTTTGKTWLNNNLGANYANVNSSVFDFAQQATVSNDHNAYGSLFQWGRKADGHELINWISGSEGEGVHGTTEINSDDPSDALFIFEQDTPYDWRVTQDDTLWASEASVKNVCPVGYRVPTGGELNEERGSWESYDPVGALASTLSMPMAGSRWGLYGSLRVQGSYGYYWGSTVSGTKAQYLFFYEDNAYMIDSNRVEGMSVRCIKISTEEAASDDVLGQIGAEGDSGDAVNSVVTVAQLAEILPVVTGIVAANEALYQDYIDANPDLFSSLATQAEVQAMVDAVNISHIANAGTSTVTASPGSITADGIAASIITVTVKDASSIPVTDASVTLAQTGTSTISEVTNVGDGTYTFTVSSTTADTVTYTATADSVVVSETSNVTFTADIANAETSTVIASPESITADGIATLTVTVTVKDASSNPVTDATVSLAQTGTSTISEVTNVGDGTYTFTVSSTTVETVTYTATADSVVVTQTSDVTFTVVGNLTIDNAALQKAIASIYDNTPYSPAIDIQGVIDAGGLTVAVPYTVGTAPVTLLAYSTSVTLDASVTQDDEAGIVATFAWTQQTNLPVGSGTFTATITIDDSNASIPDNIYNAKQLDTEDDSAGLVAATFPYDTDSIGGTGTLTLKIMPGIPDRMFGQADNTGNTETHKFLYLPVTNATTGKTWLNNNLGANYANVNSSVFDFAQQATVSDDHNAYGSLFQWGRKADGHELMNRISASDSAGINGTTSTNSDDPADALFILEGSDPYDWRVTQDDTLWASESSVNNVCPVDYRAPTGGELDEERVSWGSNDASGALASTLGMPLPGYRNYSSGATVSNEGVNGYYWGSTVSGTEAQYLTFSGTGAYITDNYRAYGFSVRCIKISTEEASDAVLAQIGAEGDSGDTVNSIVTVAQLARILPVVTGIVEANEVAYQDYIDANPELFSSIATQAEVQAMVDAVNIAGIANAVRSTVTANPEILTADGIATSTITVTVNDVYSTPVTDASVSLAQTGSSTISEVSNVGDGTYTFTVSSTTAETVTYTATADSVVVIQTTDVTFIAGTLLLSDFNMTLDVNESTVIGDWLILSSVDGEEYDPLTALVKTQGSYGNCVVTDDSLAYLKTIETNATDTCELEITDGTETVVITVTINSLYWKQTSAGYLHTAAIKSDGTLWAWGHNDDGQLGDGTVYDDKYVPTQEYTAATNWSSVSAGDGYTVAIKDDGSLWAWGSNNNGQLGDGTNTDKSVPTQEYTAATNWNSVSAGYNHTVAIKDDGSLWAWGRNYYGQLGDETNTDKSVPTRESTAATNWSSVSAGDGYTVALKNTGTLWAWGINNAGQLGDGTNEYKSVPTQEYTEATNWSSVSAGAGHTIALKVNGTLWAWGSNSYGQLGDGTTAGSLVPIQESTAATDWSSVSAGGIRTMAIKVDGTLWAWGSNGGLLGDGTTTIRLVPTQEYTAATNWNSVSAGAYHTIALKDDGSLWAWGSNDRGQLGDGTRADKSVPTQESTAARNWSSVSAGYFHTVAIKDDGSLWAWGSNNDGQLGDGTTTGGPVPIQESTAAMNWSSVSAGYGHTIAIKDDGTLWAWGSNSYGQLGDGTTTDKSVPTQEITGAMNWSSVSVGNVHTLAIKDDGTLWAWGSNSYGQLGDNGTDEHGISIDKSVPTQEYTAATNWSSVSAGDFHSIALKDDGTLWVWGDNGDGQLGDGSSTCCSLVPIQESTEATNWTSMSAGGYHTVAIKNTGTLWAWGYNGDGQLGDGTDEDKDVPTQEYTAATDWSSVSAGGEHTLAFKVDDTLWAWGNNGDGKLGDGTTTDRLVPTQESTEATDWSSVSTGKVHTMAIKDDGTLWAWGDSDSGKLGIWSFVPTLSQPRQP